MTVVSTTAEAAPPRRSLWDRVTGRAESRSIDSSTLPPVMLDGGAGGLGMSARRSLAISSVFAAVRCYVDNISALPLHVYARTGQGRERVTDGPTVELLDMPAPAYPTYQLIADIVAALVCKGDAFVAKYRDGDTVDSLGVWDPDRVEVKVNRGIPLYELTMPDGTREVHTQQDILAIRAPLSLDGIRGLSPPAACRNALQTAEAMGDYQRHAFEHDGRPSGILSVTEGPGAREQVEALRADWEARHEGPENAGRIGLLSRDVTFTQVSVDPKDLQLVESLGAGVAEVARIYSLPPSVLNAPSGDSLTYSTVESESIALLQRAFAPYLNAVERSISGDRDLLPNPNEYVRFAVDSLLRVDHRTRHETYKLGLDAGYYTVDEVRAWEDLPALDTVEVG
jgi:HK97 family phage portal protein